MTIDNNENLPIPTDASVDTAPSTAPSTVTPKHKRVGPKPGREMTKAAKGKQRKAQRDAATDENGPVNLAIRKMLPEAHRIIDAAVAAKGNADLSSQAVCRLALMHGEALIAARSNVKTFKWAEMVHRDGDRKITTDGQAWIKQVKLDFIGPPVNKPTQRTAGVTERTVAAANAYLAKAQMVTTGCKLAIATAVWGGKAADWDADKKAMAVKSILFLPVRDTSRPDGEAHTFHFPVPDKVLLTGDSYLLVSRPKGVITYSGGNFTMTKAIQTFYATPAHLRTTTSTSSVEPGDKGADTERTDAIDVKMKKTVLANATVLHDLLPALVKPLREEAKNHWTIADFDGLPDQWNVLRRLAMIYGRLTVEAQNRVNAMDGKVAPSGGAAQAATALRSA